MLPGFLLAAALSGTFELSDRSEVRLRDPGDIAHTMSLDMDTAVQSRLSLWSRLTHFSISYLPRLTLWNANVDPSPTLMQSANARIEWHDRKTRWWIDQGASYGGINMTASSFIPLVEGAPPKVDVVPPSRIIEFVSSMTTLSTHVTLRRSAIDWATGYQLSGGADATARAVLPLQSGPFAEGKFDYSATRRWHVVTKVSGAEATFSSGPESVLVFGTEGLRTTWTATTTTQLDLGAAEVRLRLTGLSASMYRTFPVAELSWDQVAFAHEHLTTHLSLRVAPLVNALYGSVDERVQLTARATWTYQRLILNALVGAQQTVPLDDPRAVQLLTGELRSSYATSKVVAFDVGVRTTAQRLNTPVTPGSSDVAQTSFVQALLFVGLSFRAPTTRW